METQPFGMTPNNSHSSLIYTLAPKLDLLLAFGGSFARKEYTHFVLQPQLWYKLWFFVAWFIQVLVFMTLCHKFRCKVLLSQELIDELKSFYVSSYSVQTSPRGYSDPVVHSLHIAFSYNLDRQFEFMKIRYGNSIYVGGDLSIVLAPKITLDLGKVSRSAKDKRKAKFRVSFSSYAFIRFYL